MVNRTTYRRRHGVASAAYGCLCALLAIACVLQGRARAADPTAAPRPNLLFILADDLAFSDLGCYGHPWHETPHLDRLAARGMRFTDAYAPAPICSASRASILTGKTPARLGFEFVTKDAPGRQQFRSGQAMRTPPFTLNLPLEERTIAERLAAAGYGTAFLGKWHLNSHHRGYLGWSQTHGPRQQGFQTAVEDFGSHPYSYRESGKPPRITTAGEFAADSMVDRACEFLHQPAKRPFFLMVSQFFVHTPVSTPCDWLLAKYDKRVPKDSLNRKRRIAYAAFVETLDHYVGQLLSALVASGNGDDTLIVFTSDNGGHPVYTANGPLRGSKWNLYEGGIRVPMIACWPEHVPAGSVCRTPVIGYDLLSTFAELAGEPVADEPPIDGVSLAGLLADPAAELDRTLVWHFPYYHPEKGFDRTLKKIGINDFAVSQTRPQAALRHGKYKLLYFFEDERSELYDLNADLGESRDLADDQRSIAADLERRLLGYLDAVGARRPVR